MEELCARPIVRRVIVTLAPAFFCLPAVLLGLLGAVVFVAPSYAMPFLGMFLVASACVLMALTVRALHIARVVSRLLAALPNRIVVQGVQLPAEALEREKGTGGKETLVRVAGDAPKKIVVH